jgi:SAM-dependent methyltransferase
MGNDSERRIVYRVEDGMDRQEIEATTYQMRNFYRQFHDGFFSSLDVMNYIQHHQAVRLSKPRDHLLDVCCGRGLLLPLLRYHQKDLGSYTGIDIAPQNAIWQEVRVTDGKPIAELDDYYPWPTRFVEGNVAEVGRILEGEAFDYFVYTASIEHMHKESGRASLRGLRSLATPGARLLLTTPNTPAEKDGYETRYRAHVYEWKAQEVYQEALDAGWSMVKRWGLTIKKREALAFAEEHNLGALVGRIYEHVPSLWAGAVLAPMYPAALADEIAFLFEPN